MYDLTTIQRMNAEAVAKHQKKVGEVYDLLDEMLYQWDTFEIDAVDSFIMAWAERIMK